MLAKKGLISILKRLKSNEINLNKKLASFLIKTNFFKKNQKKKKKKIFKIDFKNKKKTNFKVTF